MKKLLKFVAIGAGVLIVLVGAVLGIGATLPEDHVASASAVYARPPQEVWDMIADYERFPEWRGGIERVEARTFADGSSGWVEYGSTGPLPMAVDVAEPPRRLVLRIASDALPFGGTWTYVLEPEDGGTRLTITENGRVTNLLFRFMSRLVFGHTATMETYLVNLGARFGEETSPVVLQS